MCCNGKIDNSHMQLFIVRVISETSTFLNDACPVFADTCLSRACTTRAQSMSIVSFKLSCVCRKSMAISRTFPFVSSMLSRCIARDTEKLFALAIQSPTLDTRRVQGKSNEKEAVPGILLIFQKRNGGRSSFHDGLSDKRFRSFE